MHESTYKKSYVRPDNTVVITCPHCGQQKVILADAFKGHKHKLKVKCFCKKAFITHLEFRKYIRKKTVLKGTYSNHSHHCSKGNLVIHDISLNGLSFSTLDKENFKVGDEITVEFILDDELRTKIQKDVVIKNIRPRTLGCEFLQPENVYGGPLGYYIMNNL